MIHIYTTAICPRCKTLKGTLGGWGKSYTSELLDPTNAEQTTELRTHGVFSMSAPVLLTDKGYFEPDAFFDGDELDEKRLKELIG